MVPKLKRLLECVGAAILRAVAYFEKTKFRVKPMLRRVFSAIVLAVSVMAFLSAVYSFSVLWAPDIELFSGLMPLLEQAADDTDLLASLQFMLDVFGLILAAIGIPFAIWSVSYAKESIDGAEKQLSAMVRENSRRASEAVLFDDFQDPVFRRYLRSRHDELFPVAEDDPAPNGFTDDELNCLISIDVTGLPVKNLDGLSVFSNLQRLNCSETAIKELDVSGLRLLEVVRSENCTSLAEVRAWGCTMLNALGLKGSPVEMLDCSHTRVGIGQTGCERTLKTLICRAVYQGEGRFIERLSLDDYPLLETLYCQDNDIEAIAALGDSALRRMDAENNPLNYLAYDKLPKLEYIHLSRAPYVKRPFSKVRGWLPTRCYIDIEWSSEATAMPSDCPMIERLIEARDRALSLRRSGKGENARKYLKWSHARIRENDLLHAVAESQYEIDLLFVACEVELEYAACCTVAALSALDANYHYAAVDTERAVRSVLLALGKLALDGSAQKRFDWLLHRSENSLGVSFQRPRRIFPGRDTEYAVLRCSESYNYFFSIARSIIVSKHGQYSDEDIKVVDDCVRYCGNYAAALYQRAMDFYESGAAEAARLYMYYSVVTRSDVQFSLIEPVFTTQSLVCVQSISLQADSERRLAEFHSDTKLGRRACQDAVRGYTEVLNILDNLEEENQKEALTRGNGYQIARLRAQAGLASSYAYLGDHKKAYSLHQATYRERAVCLGEAHIDTIKSRIAMEQERVKAGVA